METALSLREQIEAALGEEYHKSLVDSPHGEAEDKVAWPDISVFFFNRNCQNVLEEVKKIWELVPGSRLGRKSLYFLLRKNFFSIFTEKMLQRHMAYRWLYQEIEESVHSYSDHRPERPVQ